MKKLLLLLPFFILSCSVDKDNSETFKNTTSYNVVISPDKVQKEQGYNFKLLLKPNEQKSFDIGEYYGIFDITSDETTRNFAYKFDGDVRVIYDFYKMVEYKITGTAKSASLTYSTGSGGTSQRDVNLPYTVSFDYFGNNFKYISAQNKTNTGMIKVEIYFKDRLISSDECGGDYCIATTSASIL